MKKNTLILAVGSFLGDLGMKSNAQHVNFPGVSPSISISTALNQKLDLNILATSKIRLGEQTIKEEKYSPQVLEVYSQALVSCKLNQHLYFGAGYGFLLNNPFLQSWYNESRLVQQINYAIHSKNSMFYSRIRFEERWFFFQMPQSNSERG